MKEVGPLFGNYGGNYQQNPMFNGYQQQAQQTFLPTRMDYMQSIQPQQSGVQVRFAASKEEAVAATVYPGMPVVFVNRAAREMYWKNVDDQGNVDFQTFVQQQPAPPQAPPQYVTVEMFDQWRSEFESRFQASAQRKTKGADAE